MAMAAGGIEKCVSVAAAMASREDMANIVNGDIANEKMAAQYIAESKRRNGIELSVTYGWRRGGK